MTRTWFTTREVIEATHVGSVGTLMRMVKQGILPSPEHGCHPRGKGKSLKWPAGTIGRVLEILRLRVDGLSKEDVRVALDVDRRTGHKNGIDSFRARLLQDLDEASCHPNIKHAVEYRLRGTGLYSQVLAYVEEGHQDLFLVADAQKVRIVPEVAMSIEAQSLRQPTLLLHIKHGLSSELAHVDPVSIHANVSTEESGTLVERRRVVVWNGMRYELEKETRSRT